ncbi:MAG: hypothetical protein JXQ69_01190, partial [Paludibacteraceae bacterium]|nr:hypothetical protein [Paludibacteraceae bacterium]MBN2786913.1 hypothetical protein [Paludibacteraceae bacterium]
MKTILKLHILATLLLIVSIVQAQVSNYTFSQKVVDISDYGNYIITGETYLEYNISSITKNAGKYLYLLDKKDTTRTLSGNGIPVGFDFYYDGQWMDELGVSSNAYIKLGNSKNGDIIIYNDTVAGGVFMFGYDSLRNNVISGLQMKSSFFANAEAIKIGYLRSGLPGSRTFRIKIALGQTTTLAPSVTIILREWKNTIDIFYTGINVFQLTTENAFCGLRGKAYNNDLSNLNIREVTNSINTWSTSSKGNSFSAHCDYNTSLTPPKGLVYTFTPPTPDTLRSPVAFIKCYSWDSIPNTIYLGLNTSSYVFAKGAVEIPPNATLSWSPEYTSSTNYYKLYLGLDSLDMDVLADSITATEYALSSLAQGTTYYYKIVAYNNAGVAQPCTGSFTTADDLTYCSHMYAKNTFIKTITFNTLEYNYQTTTTDEGTWDHRRELPFEAPYTTTLQRDSSYLFTITALSTAPCFGTRCWIDFNQDGVFDTSTEQFDNATTITVPQNAVLGNTKMRVGKILCTSPGYAFTPCSTEIQYQDFTITIAPNDDCTNFSVTADISNPNCYGENTGEIELNLSGGTSPYTIQWQKDGTTLSASGETLSNCTRGTY